MPADRSARRRRGVAGAAPGRGGGEAADDDADALEQLATWEGVVLATGDALERAPADPVANGLHFAALRQRGAAKWTLALTSREPWF